MAGEPAALQSILKRPSATKDRRTKEERTAPEPGHVSAADADAPGRGSSTTVKVDGTDVAIYASDKRAFQAALKDAEASNS